jgi:hypothetical protein
MATTAKKETTELVKLNLYQKLLKIQQEVVGLGKDKSSFNYKYVTGSKVLEHIKPIMNQHGLLLKQEVTSIDNERMDYLTAKGVGKTEILSKVMMRFTWIDTETGETDVNLFGANGLNEFEKGLGSALTYAERYFLLKFFHINTDEDEIDNPDRKKEVAKQPIPDARFQAALKAISGGTFTKEQLINGFELTPDQIKQLG